MRRPTRERRSRRGTLLVLLLAACSRTPESAPQPGTVPTPAPTSAAERRAETTGDLVDEARERGLDYVNVSGGSAKSTILEANGAGVAAIDLGNDGDLDLVFTQGLDSLERLVSGPGADVEVFVNDGKGQFRRASGPGLSGWWTGIGAGDVDSDGDQDLVVAGFGDLVLLVQEADGKLVPRADAGLAPAGDRRLVVGRPREKGRPPAWITSVALFDADRDGHLDVYAGHYLDLDPIDPPVGKLGTGALAVPCAWKGHTVFCGPVGLVPQSDRMLRGRGDGTFADVTATSLPDHVAGYTLGVLPFDADGDGDTDVFVANDSSPNNLLVNDGKGVFTDRAFQAGVAVSADGRAQAGMGTAAGDVNRDGVLDFAVTNFSDEPTELFFGAKVGFERMTHRFGLQRETRALLSWGVHLVDFDADGWLELLSANGHVYPEADREHTGTRYAQPATCWSLGPAPKARAWTARGAQSILTTATGGRGSAIGDFDNDGAVDVVIARIDAPASLGMNRAAGGQARLAVRCLGPQAKDLAAHGAPRTPADGHGARVVVVAGKGEREFALLAEVQTAAGYQSASSPWLSFGLGGETEFQALRILWPSGRVETLPGGPANARLVVREGAGLVSREELR